MATKITTIVSSLSLNGLSGLLMIHVTSTELSDPTSANLDEFGVAQVCVWGPGTSFLITDQVQLDQQIQVQHCISMITQLLGLSWHCTHRQHVFRAIKSSQNSLRIYSVNIPGYTITQKTPQVQKQRHVFCFFVC